MSRITRMLDDQAQALVQLAQPIIVASGVAGLTGGAMAAAGMLADRMIRRA